MSGRHKIVCRARVSDACYDGQPTTKQFGEDDPMDDDGTFDGSSIVCDACYVALMPYTRSGQGLAHELPGAIRHLRAQVAWLRKHEDPAALVAEAEAAMATAEPGTPLHNSAAANKRLAEAEIERRKGTGGDPA